MDAFQVTGQLEKLYIVTVLLFVFFFHMAPDTFHKHHLSILKKRTCLSHWMSAVNHLHPFMPHQLIYKALPFIMTDVMSFCDGWPWGEKGLMH